MRALRMLVIVTAIGFLPAIWSPAVADSKPAPRCVHVIGAATQSMGDLVADQLLKMDATGRFAYAHDTTALVSNLQCSTELLVKSVDCIVAFVRKTTKHPKPTDVVHCVETAAGQKLFE